MIHRVNDMCDFQDVWAIDNMKIFSTLPADWESTPRWAVFSKAVQTRIKADQCCLDCGGCLSPHKVRKRNMQQTKPLLTSVPGMQAKVEECKDKPGFVKVVDYSATWYMLVVGVAGVLAAISCTSRAVSVHMMFLGVGMYCLLAASR